MLSPWSSPTQYPLAFCLVSKRLSWARVVQNPPPPFDGSETRTARGARLLVDASDERHNCLALCPLIVAAIT